MGFAKVFIYDYFTDICEFDKSCVVVLLRLSIFSVYRLFAYFAKSVHQKSPYFFTFFEA